MWHVEQLVEGAKMVNFNNDMQIVVEPEHIDLPSLIIPLETKPENRNQS